MISAVQFWALFGDALCTGLLLAATLPLLGVVLVLRRQMFLAASIAQAANCGIAVALWAGFGLDHHDGHGHVGHSSLLLGLLFAIATAVTSLRALSSRGSLLEARSATIFLAGGALAMLLLAGQPHGLQQVQRLMLSSLLGATPLDVWLAAGALVVTLVGATRFRRGILLWAMDPDIAAVHGQPPWRLDLLLGAWIGAVVGTAIHSTGLTFTFGATVLPVLLAREIAPSLRATVWLAPVVGAAAFGGSFLLADRADLPPGQCATAALALLVATATATGRVLRRRGAPKQRAA